MKEIILIGSGGHALSLLEMLNSHTDFAGYVDIKENPDMPIPYLGSDEEVLKKYSSEKYIIHNAVVYAEKVNLDLRRRLIQKFGKYEAASFVAPTAIVTSNSVIGNGVAILHKAVINKAFIGSYSIINTGSIIEHNCSLGINVFVASGSTVCGNVKIGNNVFIGAGTVIRDGITIVDNVIIGCGSVVTKDITKAGVYFGNPVKEHVYGK